MSYRYFLLLGLASVATACSSETTRLPEGPPTKSFISPLGVGFDLPEGFTERQEGFVHLFQGPQDSNSSFTTISLQSRAGPLKLDLALAETFNDLQSAPNFVWHVRQPTTVDDAPAMLYAVEFEYNESMNTEVGLLLVHDGYVIDLSCLAPTELLETAVPICESILGSAHVL